MSSHLTETFWEVLEAMIEKFDNKHFLRNWFLQPRVGISSDAIYNAGATVRGYEFNDQEDRTWSRGRAIQAINECTTISALI